MDLSHPFRERNPKRICKFCRFARATATRDPSVPYCTHPLNCTGYKDPILGYDILVEDRCIDVRMNQSMCSMEARWYEENSVVRYENSVVGSREGAGKSSKSLRNLTIEDF